MDRCSPAVLLRFCRLLSMPSLTTPAAAWSPGYLGFPTILRVIFWKGVWSSAFQLCPTYTPSLPPKGAPWVTLWHPRCPHNAKMNVPSPFRDEADQAVAQTDWTVVRDRAQNVLAFDPNNGDAIAFLAAADRALAEVTSPPPGVQPLTPTSTPTEARFRPSSAREASPKTPLSRTSSPA